MKLKSLFLFLAAIAFALPMNAQTGNATLQAPSSSSITITLAGLNFSSTNTGTEIAYYLQGTCPGTLAGSTGWTVGATVAEPGVSSVTISGLTPSTQYAIATEGQPTGSASSWSGPSNCITVTTPFHPSPAVISVAGTT